MQAAPPRSRVSSHDRAEQAGAALIGWVFSAATASGSSKRRNSGVVGQAVGDGVVRRRRLAELSRGR